MDLVFISEQRDGYAYIKVWERGKHVATVWRVFNDMLIEFHIGNRSKVVVKNILPEQILSKFNHHMERAYAKN